MASEHVKTFTESNFDQEVLSASGPVLVDFWAAWCGPCRAIAPTVDALANEFNGKLTVGKLNVDDNIGVATRYGIRGIPALLLFKGGQVIESVIGLVRQEELTRLIQKHI